MGIKVIKFIKVMKTQINQISQISQISQIIQINKSSKSGLGFFVGATETPFSVYPRLPKCMHLSKKQYAKKQVSIVGTKNPKPLFNRNTPPKLTFHTFRSTLDRSKVLFWLPSDFWRIQRNNENTEKPI